jgi:ABC-type multidrug transport system fused ATPase/permease subunit
LVEVRGLFAAKFALQLLILIPALLLPWLLKIVIENVLLQKPLADNQVPYPPFMQPILSFLEGMSPMEIMFTLSVGFLVGLVLFGMRKEGGTTGMLFGGDALAGHDETAAAENKLSWGRSHGGGVFGIIEFLVSVRMNQRVGNNIRTRLFERLTRLPMATLSDQRTGDSIYRVLYDAPSIPMACLDMTLEPFIFVLNALINAFLIEYSYGTAAPELVWIAWAVVPLIFAVTFPASNLMRRVHQTKRSAGAATTNAMEETVGSIDAVQSLGGMHREAEKFAVRSLESYFRERASVIVGVLVFALGGMSVMGLSVYVTVFITNGIIEGALTPGDFAVLIGIFFYIVWGSIEIGAFWLNLQTKVAPARRVFFFIDYESDDDQTGGESLDGFENEVELDGVDLIYPDGTKALSNISLEMRKGEVIALVGPSGAGKTSLAYLIPGFLKPSRGRVLIDGQDLMSLDIDSVRSHTAGCMEFIDEMPSGLDSVLGRSGNTLSVGQQQRLSIARGLMRDARILILDEPTAALDPESENELFDALHEMSKGRLLIVIAHRLSTVQRADRIVFLADGTVKEEGSHSELMGVPDGHYRRFIELNAAAVD